MEKQGEFFDNPLSSLNPTRPPETIQNSPQGRIENQTHAQRG